MGRRKIITADAVELMKKEYPTGSLQQLSTKLGVTMRTLTSYASRLGIRRDGAVHRNNVSVSQKRLADKERLRINWGVPQKTAWHLASPLLPAESGYRHRFRKRGYVPGDYFEPGERKAIYYTKEAVRSELMERNATKMGFKFIELGE